MSSKYFFSHVLVYKMSHEPGIAFISPTPCITLSSSSQVCNEYFLTTLCLMYKGCQVNMQTDLIYRQLWKINWNDLYYFLTLSPSITTHFPHLRTSVFWKCIILLAGLCCTRELFHESHPWWIHDLHTSVYTIQTLTNMPPSVLQTLMTVNSEFTWILNLL